MYDWCGGEVYMGDVVYVTDYGVVRTDEDLQEFMKEFFEIMTVKEYLEMGKRID